jgi:hypothetical protein
VFSTCSFSIGQVSKGPRLLLSNAFLTYFTNIFAPASVLGSMVVFLRCTDEIQVAALFFFCFQPFKRSANKHHDTRFHFLTLGELRKAYGIRSYSYPAFSLRSYCNYAYDVLLVMQNARGPVSCKQKHRVSCELNRMALRFLHSYPSALKSIVHALSVCICTPECD